MRWWMVLASLASIGAAPALAADVGECGTPEAMTAKLKAEGQRAVAYADDLTVKDQYFGLMFTVNEDRSIGYVLKSDRLTNEKATRICIDRRLADIRLHDARKPGVPPSALLKATEEDGRRECNAMAARKSIKPGNCEAYNTLLHRGEERGGRRPMYQGITVAKVGDRYEKRGQLVTLSGKMAGDDPDYRSGDIKETSLPDGATIVVSVVVGPTYTAHGVTLLP